MSGRYTSVTSLKIVPDATRRESTSFPQIRIEYNRHLSTNSVSKHSVQLIREQYAMVLNIADKYNSTKLKDNLVH